MPQKVFILILLFSGMFAAYTFASPPTGTVGQTPGALFSNSAGDIGIKTAAPATALDVNGTTTIRKSLDMTNNKIINVAAPTSSADAVNKAYVDAQTANMATTTAIGLWGQGRPGTTVVNNSGECTSVISGATIKISRSSSTTATWDGARAACPANWWVCSASQRGTSACGSGNKYLLTCDPANSSNKELYHLTGAGKKRTGNWAWVSDVATTNDRMAKAASIASGTNTSEQYACNVAPVWCCSY